MTESTLSITYDTLRQAIAHYLGISVTKADWSAAEIVQLDMIVKSGLRKFYKPEKVFKDEPPHRWSFLNPTTTVTTIPSYTTGTIALAHDGTTVTLTDGTWPSWAYTNGTLVIDSTEYAIASRTSNSEIVLSAAYTGTALTAETYELRHNGIYTMPENFAGVASRTLTYAAGEYKHDVKLISDAQIRKMLALGMTGRSHPQYFAVRPKSVTVSATAGQRFELLFYPIPDEAYVLSYEMVVQTDMISDTYPYPLGGAAHGETIIAACIAAAELSESGIIGPQNQNYTNLLISSIREDQVAYQSEHIGYNGDNSDNIHNHEGTVVRTLSGLVTYEPSE
jgi:hypothetical protein